MLRAHTLILVFCSAFASAVLSAQQPAECARMNDSHAGHAAMDHAAHESPMASCKSKGVTPTLPGQAAFGAIAEVMRILEADPNTDWSRVNIEALRQHLIDMDEVTLHATVTQRAVPGGMEADVTGEGKIVAAIRRMIVSHVAMLSTGTTYRAVASDIPDGVHLLVTAADPKNVALISRIRGLGVFGLLTEGDHHSGHHLALARGDAVPHEL